MGCANVGRKGITDVYENNHGKDAADFNCDCFNVDDGLYSVENVELAVDLIKRSVSLCKKGGIELAKFVSLSSNVFQSLDRKITASKIKIDFFESINERLLGIYWHVNHDLFFYTIQQPK